MAYNPFDFFRRNQKIFMGVFVIVVMFTFVLSFGRGDFFDWLPRWLGSKKSKGEVLAVIDGDKYRESEASQLRQRRTMANKYMVSAAGKALQSLNIIASDTSKVSAENRTTLTTAYQNLNMLNLLNDSQYRDIRDQLLPNVMENYRTSQLKVEKIATDPNTKSEDLEVANAYRKFISLRSQINSDKHYFGNQPNRNAKDSLEFTLWLKKADQLKIQYRTEDVDALIEQEFLVLKSDEREKILLEMVQEGRQSGVKKDLILDAIGDEFRVRMAQIAVLGLPVVRANGNTVTAHAPFDYYEFYRTETSPAKYWILTVPVENFISKVEEQPTETELREIFNKAKNTEPDPAELKPGLKKGRQLKLGWVEVTGKEPFYATAAADALVKAEVAAKMGGLLTIGFGPGAIGTVASAGTLKLENPALQGQYDQYRRMHDFIIAKRWLTADPAALGYPLLDSSFANPQAAAATVGLAAMPLGTMANLFGVANGSNLSADGVERKQRLFAGLASISAPTLGGSAILTQYLGNLAATAHVTPAPLPLAAVKTQLAQTAREQLRFGLAQQDIKNLQDQLAKINKGEDADANQKEADALIAKFVAPASNWLDKDGKPQLGRGLKTGGSTGFFDVHTITYDPGLAPLKARLIQQTLGQPGVVEFGRNFFFDFDPSTRQLTKPTTGLYNPLPYQVQNGQAQPRPLPDDFESQYLVWRTAEVRSEPATSFEAARPKIVEIWKRQKARGLARKAAEEFSAQTPSFGNNFVDVSPKLFDAKEKFRDRFTDPAAKDRITDFEFRDVSQIVIGQPDRGAPTVTPFGLQRTNNIMYPTQKMVAQMIDNRLKPVSSSFVMVDRPENLYFVPVLLERNERSQQNFFSTVYNPDPFSKNVSPVMMAQFELESRRQAREEAIELLKAEFKYEKENENLEKLSGSGE